MPDLTDAQRNEIVICHEQATTTPRNSPGAWHSRLVALVREAGYDVLNYREAKEKAKELINEIPTP